MITKTDREIDFFPDLKQYEKDKTKSGSSNLYCCLEKAEGTEIFLTEMENPQL